MSVVSRMSFFFFVLWVRFLLFNCQNSCVSVSMCEQWIIENCDINVTVIHLTLWMFPCFSSPAPARDKSDSDWLPVGGACVGKCFLNFLERNGICLQTDMWALVLHTCSSFNELWSLYLCCLKINFFSSFPKTTGCLVDEEEEEDDQIHTWHNCPLVQKVNVNEHGHCT